MSVAGQLAELVLEQCPACHWVVRLGPGNSNKAKLRRGHEFTFERVWGDSIPLFGKDRDQLSGQLCADVLTPDPAQKWASRFERSFEGETLMLRERAGRSIWYVSVFPMQVEGEFRYCGGIAREITPWGSAEHELRHTVLGALKSQEFERNTMSRFLHDSVGQNLTAIGLQLDLIRMDIADAHPEPSSRLREVQKVLEDMMESVREYSYELNPATVERAGLRTALDRLVVRMKERFTGVLRLNVDPSIKLEPKLATAVFQVAQEALENAVQHSACTTIDITLKSSRTGTILEVRDNGRGFDPNDILGGGRGLGLLSMEHYAAQAGLDFTIASSRKTGTTVRALSS